MIETSSYMDVLNDEQRWHVEHSDALTFLQKLPDACCDSIVTDPPSGTGFMGRDWDKNKGERDKWIGWLAEIMREAFRVLKPGGHGLIWAFPRTSHWTGIALEDAGFELRDKIQHVFGSGFPKSLNVDKAIDKKKGAKRKKVGEYTIAGTSAMSLAEKGGTYSAGIASSGHKKVIEITTPESDEAKQWEGYGTGLKPAHEDWWLVRKPCEGSIVDSVLRNGTGALNINDCRIGNGADKGIWPVTARTSERGTMTGELGCVETKREVGRWPANFLLSHSAGCVCEGTREIKANPTWDTPNRDTEPSSFTGKAVSDVAHGSKGKERVPVWRCAPDCPVFLLDIGQKLDASRYFADLTWGPDDVPVPFIYQAKPSRKERDAGLQNFKRLTGGKATGRKDGSAGTNSPRAGAGRKGGSANSHPTVKSVALMRYLCRLVTPPNGVVLDVFTGSGTTGIACLREGFRFLGCELNDTQKEPFVSIARARIGHVEGRTFIPRESLRAVVTDSQGSLF